MKTKDHVHVISGVYLGYNGHIIDAEPLFCLDTETMHTTYTVRLLISWVPLVVRWEEFLDEELAPGFAPLHLRVFRAMPGELPKIQDSRFKIQDSKKSA